MLATVTAGHWPVVREVSGTRILETIAPGTVLRVLWPYQGDRLVVITPAHMGHVAAEFVEVDDDATGTEMWGLEAWVAMLEADMADNLDTLRIAGQTVEKIDVACREWEAWDGTTEGKS